MPRKKSAPRRVPKMFQRTQTLKYKRKKFVAKKRRYKRKKLAYAMIPNLKIIKQHKIAGTQNIAVFDATHKWYLQPLLYMARQAGNTLGDHSNNNIDLTQRESCAIFAKNTKIQLTIHPQETSLKPFCYRIVLGYYKGDDVTASGALTPAEMTMMNTHPKYSLRGTKLLTNADIHVPSPEDFYFKYISKMYYWSPRQIYDDNGSDDHAGAEHMRALWSAPRTYNLNFTYNKQFRYEGDDGDSLNGWVPYLFVQCVPVDGDSAFTKPTLPSAANHGSHPCPRMEIDAVTYFADVN